MTDLRAPFQYQGGKHRFAPLIVPYLLGAAPPGAAFLDAFAGSGAIAWALINAGIEPHRITMIEGSIFGTLWAALAADTFDLDAFNREGAELTAHHDRHKGAALDWLKERIATVRTLPEALPLLPYVQAAAFGGQQIQFREGSGFKASLYPYRENRVSFAPWPEKVTARILALSAHFRRYGAPSVIAGTVTASGLRAALNRLSGPVLAYLDPPYEGTAGYSHGFAWREFLSEPVRCPVFVSEYAEAGHSIRLTETTKGGIQGKKLRIERLNFFAPGFTV